MFYKSSLSTQEIETPNRTITEHTMEYQPREYATGSRYNAQPARSTPPSKGYNPLHAGAPEDLIGDPSEYKMVTRPSRSIAWIACIALVVGALIAAVVMGAVATHKDHRVEDEFTDLYSTNIIFFTNRTTFIAGANPDNGTIADGAFVSIARVGYKVDVNVKFDLRNGPAGDLSPVWCSDTSPDVFNGTLGAYLDISCVPPPYGYVPCHNSTVFPLCENITSGPGAHPGSRIVPVGGVAGPILTSIIGVTGECNLEVTNVRAFDGAVNGTGVFVGGVFVPKTLPRNTTTCAFNQPQTLQFQVSYMTLSARDWQPPAVCKSTDYPLRLAPGVCT